MGALLDLALSEREGSEPQAHALAIPATDDPVSTAAEAATKETRATEVSVPRELETRRARVESQLLADGTLRVAFDVAKEFKLERDRAPSEYSDEELNAMIDLVHNQLVHLEQAGSNAVTGDSSVGALGAINRTQDGG